MPFLTLNGIEVKCAAAGSSYDFERLGERGRSFNGALRKSERARKRGQRFRAPLLTLAESRAVQGLVEGEGHHWNFDADFYADTGLGPSLVSAAAANVGPVTGWGQYGHASDYGGEVRWSVGTHSAWTLIAPLYFRTIETWQRWMLRSDGVQWRDGGLDSNVDGAKRVLAVAAGALTLKSPLLGGFDWAASQARALGSIARGAARAQIVTVAGTTGAVAPTWGQAYGATTTDGSVTWRCIGADWTPIADMAYLPFAVPDAWAPAIAAFNLGPWSALPALTANGDAFGNVATLVLGEVTNVEAVEFVSGGVWTPGESVEFSLFEV